MISPSDRINAVNLIDEAVTSGARRTEACKNMGINDRTYRRWTAEDEVRADARPESVRPQVLSLRPFLQLQCLILSSSVSSLSNP